MRYCVTAAIHIFKINMYITFTHICCLKYFNSTLFQNCRNLLDHQRHSYVTHSSLALDGALTHNTNLKEHKQIYTSRSILVGTSEEVGVQRSSDIFVEAYEQKLMWRMRRGEEDSEDDKNKDVLSIVSKRKQDTEKTKSRREKTSNKYCRSLRIQKRDGRLEE